MPASVRAKVEVHYWQFKYGTDSVASNFHLGMTDGFISFLVRIPSTNSLIVILCNSSPTDFFGICGNLAKVLYNQPVVVKEPVHKKMEVLIGSKGVAKAVDEFQKIHEWPTGKLMLEKLRSCWQRHHDVCYCLYGSKRHLMANLFSDSSQPFYKFGETIFLDKIEREEWIPFLIHQFKISGKSISPELAGMIVDRTGRHSYYVQYFARLCWSEADNTIKSQHLESAWINLLNDHLPVFRQ